MEQLDHQDMDIYHKEEEQGSDVDVKTDEEGEVCGGEEIK